MNELELPRGTTTIVQVDPRATLPRSPPRWLRPELVGGAAMTVAAASTTHLVTGWVGWSPLSQLVRIAIGTLAAAAILALVFQAKSALRAFGRSLVGGLAYTFFSIALLTAITFVQERSYSALLVVFYGLLVGVPLGAALSLFYGIVAALVGRARERPSHEASARVAWTSAIWLASLAAIHRHFVESPAFSTKDLPLAAATWIAPLVLAIAFAGWGVGTSVAQRRWIARVRAGAAPGWKIAPRPSAVTPGILPLRASAKAWACEEVLVRVLDGSENVGYRDAARSESERIVALL